LSKHVVKTMIRKILQASAKAVLLIGLLLVGITSAQAQGKIGEISLPPIKEILSDRILGKMDAAVTIIEYASMTCSHCAAFHAGPFPALKKEYIETGKIKFIFRDFPLDRLALAAAMMARCAPKERYFPIIDIIFRTQQNWAKVADPAGALAQVGLLSGISQKTYEACVSNKDIYDGIMKIRNDGDKKFNVQSTPTILINGKALQGSMTIEHLRTALDAELAKLKK
jgi:protein-disulfide isomerase